jgi:D-sedoheptulose 7-phosphate isomerase
MKDIRIAVENGVKAIQQLQLPSSILFMSNVATTIAECLEKGNKVIIAGNGGSLCDAMHFAEELTGQFRAPRRALPAIALSCPGHITCAANDFGFENVFSRGVEAYGKPGDVFVGLTTSGNSQNIINAFEAAFEKDMTTVAFLGKGGGKLKEVADLEICIDGFSTSDRVQEAHMTAIHIIIEIVEKKLFALQPALVDV